VIFTTSDSSGDNSASHWAAFQLGVTDGDGALVGVATGDVVEEGGDDEDNDG